MATLLGVWLDGSSAVVIEHCRGPITDLRPWANRAGAVSVDRMGRETETELLRHCVRAAPVDDELIGESRVDEEANGVVTLVGTVGGHAKKLMAQLVAQGADGVDDLVNAIEAAPTPNDVRTAMAGAPDREAAHSASRLDVVVDGSTVSLHGAVRSPAERAVVVGAVGHAPGISQTRNEPSIEADRPPSPER